ncbi:hypothetical protein INR49_015526 [Caranx melampygus]|nr:hypothetical protein INR49_015526 [Caranx melampygus]
MFCSAPGRIAIILEEKKKALFVKNKRQAASRTEAFIELSEYMWTEVEIVPRNLRNQTWMVEKFHIQPNQPWDSSSSIFNPGRRAALGFLGQTVQVRRDRLCFQRRSSLAEPRGKAELRDIVWGEDVVVQAMRKGGLRREEEVLLTLSHRSSLSKLLGESAKVGKSERRGIGKEARMSEPLTCFESMIKRNNG